MSTATERPTMGSKIKELRLRAGMSATQLAAKADIAYSSIAYYESDKHTPSVATLDRLCEALGVTMLEFVDCFRPVDRRRKNRGQ